jgi:hypothetical protein
MYADDVMKVNKIGLYYICDGGYPKFKHIIPPYKWTQVGTKKNLWSSAIESARKYVERFFGILKRRWRCLINPVDLLDPSKIEKMCGACCILHNMRIDHDGLANWEHRMCRYRFTRGVGDTVNLTAVQVSLHRMTDDILYNHGEENAPGPNHTNKYEDYYANNDTDHDMTHSLRNLIKRYYLGKYKKEIRKLKKCNNTI